jgi:hypothetical protein
MYIIKAYTHRARLSLLKAASYRLLLALSLFVESVLGLFMALVKTDIAFTLTNNVSGELKALSREEESLKYERWHDQRIRAAVKKFYGHDLEN